MTASTDGASLLETYNVYDDRGLLRYVLSPDASHRLSATINETVLKQFAYSYDYDLRGRMTVKRQPGCEPVYMVYDNKDRLVLSQDGKQRAENANKWSYSLYDKKNRVTESGEVVLANTTSHTALQAVASASDNYTPTGTRTALQYNLYDSYTASANVPVHAFIATADYSTDYHKLVTGLITSTRIKVLDAVPEKWLTITTYYDDKDQIIQTVSDNLQGYKSQYNVQYDFSGRVVKERESHKISSTVTDIVETVHRYDDQSRLLSSMTTLNSGTPAVTTYAYDAIGRCTSRTVGNTTESMNYNVRGWLTSKTSPQFKMNLRYQSTAGGTTARWNGNISEWDWQHGSNPALMYGFTYDSANRLKATTQKQKSGSSWTNISGYDEKGITYDLNGNLLTLQRTAAGTTIDNLLYGYTGNKLSQLTESVRTAPANDIYAPGSTASGTYSYDANGNMVSDSRKGLTFTYNLLNLPTEVKQGTSTKAKYTWLVDGSKLRVRDAGSNGFDYLGSLTYASGSSGLRLESAGFTGGVIRVSGT
ncbi:RHS repeat protein, partial [Alistipes sp. OttesenSCG-928-L06]|nr:RHS repeat protein [Alistipes sp. OttesenSCG-928-L06]